MKLGLSSRVRMHTSDHVNLSNRQRVRPGDAACNYTEELDADAGDDSGSGNLTRSTRM